MAIENVILVLLGAIAALKEVCCGLVLGLSLLTSGNGMSFTASVETMPIRCFGQGAAYYMRATICLAFFLQ